MIRTSMRHEFDCRSGSVVRDPNAKGVGVFVCTNCGAQSTTEPRH